MGEFYSGLQYIRGFICRKGCSDFYKTDNIIILLMAAILNQGTFKKGLVFEKSFCAHFASKIEKVSKRTKQLY